MSIKNLISCGFVASHLADLLLEKGEEVYIYCRWTDDKRSFEHIKDKVHWMPMDLNDAWSCLKAIEEVKPDYIFHLGAQSSVPESFAYPAQTLMTNGIGTLNLLEAVRIVRDNQNKRAKCYECNMVTKYEYVYDPVIHVCSSSEVYGVVPEEKQPI